MKALRHYVQHRSFPITRRRVSVKMIEGTDRYEMKHKILLSRQELLAWDGWTLKPNKYINNLKEDIEIKPLCKEYYEHIVNFDKTFLISK